ncbi:MAG: response regulator transcription factor [Parasphingorhabdus sp.]|uniref:response regulator transcription factor n=1 Tax=Parasphingorhabdus sp. TaxID=2709688 RepID=UPI00329681A7
MALTDREKSPATIVVADDHAIVRQATVQILSSIPDTEIVAEAENGLDAMAAVRKYLPDMLVLDAAMPYAKGVEVFAEARRWSPKTRVAILTGFTSSNLLAEWMDMGVEGLFLKSCDPDEIKRGFETILAGHNFVAQSVAKILQDAVEPVSLTAREREVLSLIGSGHANAAIADRLSISIKTVEKHRGSLMGKLGVRSVAELLAYALKEGLLETHKQL